MGVAGSGDTARPGGASEQSAPIEAADPWSRLARAESAEQFGAVWLELQHAATPGMRRGIVVLGAKERGPFAPVAVWPAGVAPSRALADAIEQAVIQRKPVARLPRGPVDPAKA